MEDYNTATLPHEKFYDIEKYEMKKYQKKMRKAHEKQKEQRDNAPGGLVDEERIREERRAAREAKEKEEFRLLLQTMDKEKVEAMRRQEQLRAEMQLHYKAGNVAEARRLEQIIS